MQKIFQEYGGVIVTTLAIVALIGVVGLMFAPAGNGWMDGSFHSIVNKFSDKVAVAGEVGPVMLEGDGSVVSPAEIAPLRFRSSAPLEELQEVQVDGSVVDPSNYTTASGSTVVVLSDEYLASLSKGTHTMTIVSESGSASGDFSIGFVVPKAATYFVASSGKTFEAGELVESLPATGDIYTQGDYEYRYNQARTSSSWATNDTLNGWGVRILDSTKSTYSAVEPSINGRPITTMNYAFYKATKLTSLASDFVIPPEVSSLSHTFERCLKLTSLPEGFVIPNSVTNMIYTFSECSVLDLPNNFIIPGSVTSLNSTFYTCSSLTVPPVLSNGTQSMMNTFEGCKALTKAPAIPSTVTVMNAAFKDCKALSDVSAIRLPASLTSTSLSSTFFGCASLTDLSGLIIPSSLTSLNATFKNCTALTHAPAVPSSITDLSNTFEECVSLVSAPDLTKCTSLKGMQKTFSGCRALTSCKVIPASVTNLNYVFSNCSALEGTIEINCAALNTGYYTGALQGTTKPITLTGSATTAFKSALAGTAKNGNVSY